MLTFFKGSMPKRKGSSIRLLRELFSHCWCSVIILVLLALVLVSSGKPVVRRKGLKKNIDLTNAARKYNDGTSNPEKFYHIDDMLFLNRTKEKNNRAGQYRDSYRWPQGRIPYTFAPGYSDDEMRQIFFTMKYLEQYTCVRFVFRTEADDNYLYIRNVEGKCQSFVGNVRRGAQQVALDPDSRSCAVPNFPGHVLHELIHALGFFHEHARDDRDNYIDILYDNLSENDDVLRNFYKNVDSDKQVDYFGVPYNYGSIMHYSEKAGSITGEATIVRKNPLPVGVPKPLEGEMGQRERLTEGDTQMIRNMYKDICPPTAAMVSHGMMPRLFPDVVDWVAENDHGTEIRFPIENADEDDDDDDDYDDSIVQLAQNTI